MNPASAPASTSPGWRRALQSPWPLLALISLLILAAFVLWPLLTLFRQSAVDPQTGALGWHGFRTFIEDARYTTAFANSLLLGVVTTIGSLLLGAPLAYVVARYDFRGKSLVALLPLATIVLPDFLVAQAWLMLLGNNGVLRLALEDLGIDLPSFYGWFGMIFTLVFNLYAYAYLGMFAALKAIDGAIEEAAVNLGASNLRRALTVTFPVLLPALLVNAMIVFTLAVDNFSIPMILGGKVEVLSSLIYITFLSEMGGNPVMQSVLAVVSVLLVALVLLVQKSVVERKTYQMHQGRPPPAARARGWAARSLTAAALLLMALSMLPAAVMVVGAFTKARGPVLRYGQWTLENMERALGTAPAPIVNSLLLATAATLAGTLFATIASYLIVKKRSALVSLLDYVAMLPLAVSGTVLGIALIHSYNTGPVVLTGTWIIMAAALFVRKVPFSIRSASASLYNIPDSMEEAAINLGASPLQSFRSVVLPVMKPAIWAAAILMWVTSLAEISATIVLYYGGMETMPIEMFNQIDAGYLARASAYGVVLMAAIIVPLFIATRVFKLELFSSN